MNRNPSLFDVARHCGVSHQTVSRVVNGHANVSAATRAKVLAAIEELGYRQNLAARALATGRTKTLGVLSFDSPLFGPTAMLHSIQVAAREKGYGVVLNSVGDISDHGIAAGIAELARSNVDGILVITPRTIEDSGSLNAGTKVPLVFREIRAGEALAVVDIDQFGAAKSATEYLIARGHKAIAHISGPESWVTSMRRREGWEAAVGAAGIEAGPLAVGDWSPRSGYQATKALLGSGAKFTALFAANDAMALGAYRALAEAGLSVPEDVSVVGFDDTPESEFAVPALTTVRQDFDQVGEVLLDLLLRAIEGEPSKAQPQLVAGELILRESVQTQ